MRLLRAASAYPVPAQNMVSRSSYETTSGSKSILIASVCPSPPHTLPYVGAAESPPVYPTLVDLTPGSLLKRASGPHHAGSVCELHKFSFFPLWSMTVDSFKIRLRRYVVTSRKQTLWCFFRGFLGGEFGGRVVALTVES